MSGVSKLISRYAPILIFIFSLFSLCYLGQLVIRDGRHRTEQILADNPPTLSSLCSDAASRVGPGQKIISYSLFTWPTPPDKAPGHSSAQFIQPNYALGI